MLRRTMFLMFVCGVLSFLLLGIRLFQIQILEHGKYESAAVEQQLRETTVTAMRGAIYDRNKNILAISVAVSNIYISPAEIEMYGEDKMLIANGLSSILGVDQNEILEMAGNTSSWYSVVARKVDDSIANQVRTFKEENDLIGVKIEEASKRYYPYDNSASHVIGFTSGDDHGLAGLEYYYDDVLSGTNGRIIQATTAYGEKLMFTDFDDTYNAQDGQSIVTTIDMTVQSYLEGHLSDAAENYDLQDGAAGIVMDVNTGAILAMASIGDFDPNNYLALNEETEADIAEQSIGLTTEEYNALISAAQAEMWRNKALSDTYEPGSVFKIITLAAGLESGAVDLNSTFYCGGSLDVLGRTEPVNCWNLAGHNDETLEQAVMNSCNVAFVNIGQRIGAERFYKYIRAFGLFEQTDIDLTGEADSIWWTEDVFFNKSNLSQLAAASFGQTFTITPIQLITAVSAVANGGYLMQPYIVSEILNADGSTFSQTEPVVIRQVISEETSRKCCEMLEQVVGNEHGTGTNAYVPGYRVCGKTGTSEDIVYQASHGSKRYIASFLGFAPANDPQVAVLVLLKNPGPKSTTYVSGGQMGAPTVGAILQDILPYLEIQPQYSEGEEALVDQRMPRLIGKSLQEATEILEAAGFTIKETIGQGDTVTAQLPAANSKIASGSEVFIYCGEELDTTLIPAPDLLGLSYEIARIRAGWSNLYIQGEGAMLDSTSILTVRQSIPAGELVEPGTVIKVTLSDSSNLGRY